MQCSSRCKAPGRCPGTRCRGLTAGEASPPPAGAARLGRDLEEVETVAVVGHSVVIGTTAAAANAAYSRRRSVDDDTMAMLDPSAPPASASTGQQRAECLNIGLSHVRSRKRLTTSHPSSQNGCSDHTSGMKRQDRARATINATAEFSLITASQADRLRASPGSVTGDQGIIADPAIPVHRRAFAAAAGRPAEVDAIGGRMIGEQRQAEEVADHIEDRRGDAESRSRRS